MDISETFLRKGDCLFCWLIFLTKFFNFLKKILPNNILIVLLQYLRVLFQNVKNCLSRWIIDPIITSLSYRKYSIYFSQRNQIFAIIDPNGQNFGISNSSPKILKHHSRVKVLAINRPRCNILIETMKSAVQPQQKIIKVLCDDWMSKIQTLLILIFYWHIEIVDGLRLLDTVFGQLC